MIGRGRGRFLVVLLLMVGPPLAFGALPAGLSGGLIAVIGPLRSFCETLLAAVHLGGHSPHLLGAATILATFALVTPGAVAMIRQIAEGRRLHRVLISQQIGDLPAHFLELARRAGLDGRVRAFQSDDFHAFCLGVFRPEVWVASTLVRELPGPELEAVLRHEAWHLRRHDPLRVLLAKGLCNSFFFVPAVLDLTRALMVNKELIADAGTVREMDDKFPLASALQFALNRGLDSRLAEQPVGAFGAIDARIDQLVDSDGLRPLLVRVPASSLLASAPAVCLAILAGCLLLTGAELPATAGGLCLGC